MFAGHELRPLRQEARQRACGQRAGLISYKYGKLTILDPEGLAESACECYPMMEAQFDKIFDQPWREAVQDQAGTSARTSIVRSG